MENRDYQKRVAAIHDLSGFGKCSLTVALPILSAAGIEACAMPTAILSTHTGGISGYTYRDLTSDMRAFMQHWKSLDIQFDATYSGFLGSFEQLDLVKEFFELFRSKNNLILVDPVMADNGELYRIFQPEFATGMRSLCRKADIIVPNLTEAALLLEESYHPGPYTQAYIEKARTGKGRTDRCVLRRKEIGSCDLRPKERFDRLPVFRKDTRKLSRNRRCFCERPVIRPAE